MCKYMNTYECEYMKYMTPQAKTRKKIIYVKLTDQLSFETRCQISEKGSCEIPLKLCYEYTERF